MTASQLDAIPTWPFIVGGVALWLAVAWSHRKRKVVRWKDVKPPKKPWREDRS